MDIIISNTVSKPIYDQIASQIKGLVMSDGLAPGDQLPSIRALANDLHVSVITTKRAYADLEASGFIETRQGKGSFVAGENTELLRKEHLKRIEELLTQAIDEAKSAGVDTADLHEMLDALAE